MNYQETCTYLFEKLASYQKTGGKAFNKSLSKTLLLASELDNPQSSLKTIHIAGTNGKGSSAAILTSILMEAGYKVGTYTSPHLNSFTERIRVNGHKVTEDFVVAFTKRILNFIEVNNPSFFEITTLMAFSYFKEKQVDVAVIETGLGGRLDSTNIIQPLVSLITNISLDHQGMLGNTLKEIASEKAGIIKDHTAIIISEKQVEVEEVFKEYASMKDAPLKFAEDEVQLNRNEFEAESIKQSFKYGKLNLQLDLGGHYQMQNLKGALAVVEELNESKSLLISNEAIQQGTQNVLINSGIKGRWEIRGLNPKVICDTGHNTAGLKIVFSQLAEESYDRLYIVWGMVNDKDPNEILSLLPSKYEKLIICQPKIERAMPANKLQEIAFQIGLKGEIIEDVNEAVTYAKENAGENDVIFVGGSTFVIGELK